MKRSFGAKMRHFERLTQRVIRRMIHFVGLKFQDQNYFKGVHQKTGCGAGCFRSRVLEPGDQISKRLTRLRAFR